MRQKVQYGLLFIVLLICSACQQSPIFNQQSPPTVKDTPVRDSQASMRQEPCSFYLAKENMCLSLDWSPFLKPYQKITAKIQVHPKDEPDDLVNPEGEVCLFLYMRSMGHGLAKAPEFSEVSDGNFEFKNIIIPMKGEWDLYLGLLESRDACESTSLKPADHHWLDVVYEKIEIR
ncbi:MAG TPA: hypothetical protein PKC21_03010 [Oligoflexia bacterium]|nr:hypothetical protein [Oligoflexia bacterium]HMR24303.1 hypothetical protein [Oligoflexia bacterium]